MLTYVLPTRNRPERLKRTLAALGELDPAAHSPIGGGEVIVVDNASTPPAAAPLELANGFPVRVVYLDRNEGAAARNRGVELAAGDWVVMLDDDSHPIGCGHLDAMRDAASDTAAIGAEISLPNGRRESGGLPEVFIGCGVAIRRRAFQDCGGYDPAFDFYAEEYDLCAQLLRAGWRVEHDRRFRVLHEKATDGRSFNRIMRRLVRNNTWVMRRYAPGGEQARRIGETMRRYGRIALREGATGGYALGAAEAIRELRRQPRRPLDRETFDRFTGLAAARTWLYSDERVARARRVAIVDRGKNDWAIERALSEMGIPIVRSVDEADALVIGTLSPGPMQDSLERRSELGQPVAAPWTWQSSAPARSAAA